MRRFALMAACLAAAACAAFPRQPAPPVDRLAVEVDRLHEQVAEVARAQADADRQLGDALTAVRQVDETVSMMRDPVRTETGRQRWPAVAGAASTVDPAAIRPALFEVAYAVDRARATLHRLRPRLDADWEIEYLDAEDRLLLAVRHYAEVADALAQAIIVGWPTYREVVERSDRFASASWTHRSSAEAADAYEIEVGPLVPQLARVQAAFAVAREARDAAAGDVNAAAVAVSEVWARRPAGSRVGSP